MGIVIARRPRHLFTTRLGRLRRWVCCRLGDSRHEQRVMQIAVALFDLTAKRHELKPRHRRILELAAFLHDIGRVHGAERHNVHGARMLLDGSSLHLRGSERAILAHLTRYHRGRLPACRADWTHPELESARSMQLLLAMLRAADALDSRNFATPALSIRLKGDRLRIRCYVHDLPRAEECFLKKKKYRLLEALLGLRIQVQLRHADSADIVW
jgi:exopolyphosphatase / guanosine-5'-triphosphate,3'-diphosphate pyrophosphatase